ncbi:tRNA adenosine(34) deaminase TadA [Mycoplasmatota bacterium WC30]
MTCLTSNPTINEEFFMQEALKEAKKAYDKREVPVGCVIVKENKIIARAHNQRETTQSTLSHAEIIAIGKACKKLKSWRLEDCDIYVTLEPCIMCSGAIINARIKRLIYGALEPKFGAHKSLTNVFNLEVNHKVEVIPQVLAQESNQLLKTFFKNLRSEKN